MINKAMDDLRKTERRHHEELKGSKYVFLKNQKNLTSPLPSTIDLKAHAQKIAKRIAKAKMIISSNPVIYSALFNT